MYRCLRTTRFSTILDKIGVTDIDRKQVKESPLPLTDPRDAVAQRMLNSPYRIVW